MQVDKPPLPPQGRLVSLDAYRGLAMLLMASDGFGFPAVAKQPQYRNSQVWQFLAFHTDHVDWVGGSLWDMIQPSFMFMVGVALIYSIGRRKADGDSFARLLPHVIFRSVMLIAIGIFLRSNGQHQTVFGFTDVLIQIGLGYPFLFLLSWTRPRTQAIVAAAILVLYWAAFALYPAPTPEVFASLSAPKDLPHLTGFYAHWEKNTNLASAFDRWFLNLFPREKPFKYGGFGTQTLNFIPSLATMIFGLLAGYLLRSGLSAWRKVGILVLAGIAGILMGQLLHAAGICPNVRKVWTPSWALFSTGWVCLSLATFYAIIDVVGLRRWAFLLVVVGMNSIAMYALFYTSRHFVIESFDIHLGQKFFSFAGAAFAPVVKSVTPLIVWWLILFWMYRRRIFLRV